MTESTMNPPVFPNRAARRTRNRMSYDDNSAYDEQSSSPPEERLAAALGWFSIGLGAAELLMPGRMADAIGVYGDSRTRNMLRTYGIREIMAGVGILTQQRPSGWMWGRVAGDVLDLGTLVALMRSNSYAPRRTAVATAAVFGVTALDVVCAQGLMRPEHSTDRGMLSGTQDVYELITIMKPADEIYTFWRNFENLPRFMRSLETVRVTGDLTSEWTARAPAGRTVTWQAEITTDEPASRIAWQSLPGSDIENEGQVTFEPATGGRGTVVRVRMSYKAPGGIGGVALAKLFGEEPAQQVKDALRTLKQVLEVGEVVQSDASIHTHMHPGQPSPDHGNPLPSTLSEVRSSQ